MGRMKVRVKNGNWSLRHGNKLGNKQKAKREHREKLGTLGK